MIEVKITEDMKKNAWRKAKRKELRKLKNSIRRGGGVILGLLGQEVANHIIGGEIAETYDYDITHAGVTYEIKTKQCTSEPMSEYDCTVSAYNTKQICDNYVFIRIENKGRIWGRAWVLGWLSKDEFFEKATFLKRGEKSGKNGFYARSDCYNIPISKLNKFPTKCKKPT
jgi:hypothetical protein